MSRRNTRIGPKPRGNVDGLYEGNAAQGEYGKRFHRLFVVESDDIADGVVGSNALVQPMPKGDYEWRRMREDKDGNLYVLLSKKEAAAWERAGHRSERHSKYGRRNSGAGVNFAAFSEAKAHVLALTPPKRNGRRRNGSMPTNFVILGMIARMRPIRESYFKSPFQVQAVQQLIEERLVSRWLGRDGGYDLIPTRAGLDALGRRNPRRRNGGKITDSAKSWRNAAGTEDYAAVYKRWHWGVGHDEVVEWADRDLPKTPLIEIGRLWELHIRLFPSGKEKVIEVGDRDKNASYLAFDPKHPHQRMYLLVSKAVQQDAKQLFWDRSAQKPQLLAAVAKAVGSRHAKGGYPQVKVKVVGRLQNVVYRTHKKGDDDHLRGSSYIHAMGEDGGVQPNLAVDAKGRLWIAGGSYICPTPGITD
jgi:hypothetical protein